MPIPRWARETLDGAPCLSYPKSDERGHQHAWPSNALSHEYAGIPHDRCGGGVKGMSAVGAGGGGGGGGGAGGGFGGGDDGVDDSKSCKSCCDGAMAFAVGAGKVYEVADRSDRKVDLSYRPNSDCSWDIAVPKGYRVALRLIDLDLAPRSHNTHGTMVQERACCICGALHRSVVPVCVVRCCLVVRIPS